MLYGPRVVRLTEQTNLARPRTTSLLNLAYWALETRCKAGTLGIIPSRVHGLQLDWPDLS